MVTMAFLTAKPSSVQGLSGFGFLTRDHPQEALIDPARVGFADDDAVNVLADGQTNVLFAR